MGNWKWLQWILNERNSHNILVAFITAFCIESWWVSWNFCRSPFGVKLRNQRFNGPFAVFVLLLWMQFTHGQHSYLSVIDNNNINTHHRRVVLKAAITLQRTDGCQTGWSCRSRTRSTCGTRKARSSSCIRKSDSFNRSCSTWTRTTSTSGRKSQVNTFQSHRLYM